MDLGETVGNFLIFCNVPQHPGQKMWNNYLSYSLFQEPIASIIAQTNIITDDCADNLCWDLIPNGKCNSKSTYKLYLQDIQSQPNNQPS